MRGCSQKLVANSAQVALVSSGCVKILPRCLIYLTDFKPSEHQNKEVGTDTAWLQAIHKMPDFEMHCTVGISFYHFSS